MRTRGAIAGLDDSASIFAALGDETRLKLVARLSRGGPQSVTQLTKESPYTRQAISKHLRVLALAGLARGSRRGRETRWELRAEQLDVARRYLDSISERWDVALKRLREFVEE